MSRYDQNENHGCPENDPPGYIGLEVFKIVKSERDRLAKEVERLRSEVADAINNMYFAEAVANSAIERRGKAEAEVERLRKLCADRPRIEFYGESSFSPSIPSAEDISEWNAKIDAEGRRAAGRGEG
jgi:hypothetical protein